MPWSGITSVVTYSAANAIAIPHPVLEPIKVTTIHPGTGGDGIVTLYGSDGKPVATANVSASDSVQTIEFSTASQTLNYSTSAVFASPGLSIIASASQISPLTPSSDGAVSVVPFEQRFRAHGQIVPMAGQTVRVVIRGDSIQANAVTGGSMQLAAILSGGEYMIAWNDAVPGSTLPQFDARYDSIPSWVKYDQDWIQGGSNAATTAANQAAILSLARKSIARGAEPVFFAIPPANGNPNATYEFNAWLWGWCVKYGFKFINPWTEIIDPATGLMAAAYTFDSLHPTFTGHVLAAKRILECLRPNASAASGFRALPCLPTVNAPTGAGVNVINNALFANSAGGLATGWTAGATAGTTVTPSIVALSLPYIGNAQRFQVTTTNAWRIQSRVTAIVGGRRYRLIEYLKLASVASDAARNGRLEIAIYDQRGAALSANGVWADVSVAIEGILIRDFVAPVGDTSVTIYTKLYVSAAGNASADYSIGCQQCYDLTTLGVD